MPCACRHLWGVTSEGSGASRDFCVSECVRDPSHLLSSVSQDSREMGVGYSPSGVLISI